MRSQTGEGKTRGMRLAGAGFALVLHAFLILFLLRLTLAPSKPPEQSTVHETIITLAEPHAMPAGRHGTGAHPAAPQAPAWQMPTFAPQPDASGIGAALFDCTPENLDRLSVEQRAKCHLALGGPGHGWTDYRPPANESRYASLWAASLAKRRTPLRVPCTGAIGGTTGGPSASNPMAARSPTGPPSPLSRGITIGVDPVCAGALVWHYLNR